MTTKDALDKMGRNLRRLHRGELFAPSRTTLSHTMSSHRLQQLMLQHPPHNTISTTSKPTTSAPAKVICRQNQAIHFAAACAMQSTNQDLNRRMRVFSPARVCPLRMIAKPIALKSRLRGKAVPLAWGGTISLSRAGLEGCDVQDGSEG